jgi:hypothetical protein
MKRFVAETDYNVAESSSRVSSAQQQGLDSYIKRESLGELLAKCVANDGFIFHAVTNSSEIGEFINKRGYTMPKCGNTIIKLVLDFFEEKKTRTIKTIITTYFLIKFEC